MGDESRHILHNRLQHTVLQERNSVAVKENGDLSRLVKCQQEAALFLVPRLRLGTPGPEALPRAVRHPLNAKKEQFVSAWKSSPQLRSQSLRSVRSQAKPGN